MWHQKAAYNPCCRVVPSGHDPFCKGSTPHNPTGPGFCLEAAEQDMQYKTGTTLRKTSICCALILLWELSELERLSPSGRKAYVCRTHRAINLSFACSPGAVEEAHAWLSTAADGGCARMLRAAPSKRWVTGVGRHKSSFPRLLRGKIFLEPSLVCGRNIKDVSVFFW